jgi:hypothetical protein
LGLTKTTERINMTPQQPAQAAQVETAQTDSATNRLRRKGQSGPGPAERRPSPQDSGNRQGKSHTGSQTTGDMKAEFDVPAANLSLEELYANLGERLGEVAAAEAGVAENRWVAVGETLIAIYLREKVAESDQRKMNANIKEMFVQHGLIEENLLRLNLLVRCSDLRLATKREKDGLRDGIRLQDAKGQEHTFRLENEAGLTALKTLNRSMTSIHAAFAAQINEAAGRQRAKKAVATLEEVADTPEVIKHRVQNEKGEYESQSFADNKEASQRLVIGLCKLWGPKMTQDERESFMDKIESALTATPAFVPQASKQGSAQGARKTA